MTKASTNFKRQSPNIVKKTHTDTVDKVIYRQLQSGKYPYKKCSDLARPQIKFMESERLYVDQIENKPTIEKSQTVIHDTDAVGQ